MLLLAAFPLDVEPLVVGRTTLGLADQLLLLGRRGRVGGGDQLVDEGGGAINLSARVLAVRDLGVDVA